MKKIDTKLLPDKEPIDFSAPQVFVDQKPKWKEIRVNLSDETTVADLLLMIGDRKPEEVYIEYAGCGTHDIELSYET